MADELRDVLGREPAALLGLDVEHADDLVVPGERDRQHRGDEPPLVQAADPQEARVLGDVVDDDRLAARGRAPGDPLAERHDRAADVVAVQAVGRGRRQRQPVAVHEVQRRDLGPERDPRAVHDGLEELLPGLGGGREAEQLVEEPELGDGVVRRRRVREVGLGRAAPAPRSAVPARPGPASSRRRGAEQRLGIALLTHAPQA